MKTITQLLFCVLMIMSTTFYAQDINNTEPPYIEVIGTATKDVIPDQIFVEIILSEKTINKKAYPIEEQEARLKNIIKSLNIDLNKLNLSDSNTKIIYRRYREKGVSKTKEYILEVNSVSVLGNLFTSLNNADIKEVEIIKTEHSKIIEFRKEVRIKAIKAAKTKAKYLLEAIDETLGKPIVINEINTLSRDNLRLTNQANGYNMTVFNSYEKSKSGVINFKPIEIKFSYYVKYEIK